MKQKWNVLGYLSDAVESFKEETGHTNENEPGDEREF